MNLHDVKNLIQEGEGYELEFKRRISSPEKIARTLIALANTKGGYVLFGVDDDGSIVGVESEKSEIELIYSAAQDFSDPPINPIIEVVPFNGKDVVVCYIEESKNKPHYFLGENNIDVGEVTRVYIRVNDKTMMASKEVVKILKSENPDAPPMKISIGENERRLFKYLEEHERITVKEFGRLVNISDRRASRILVRLVHSGVLRIHTNEKTEYFTLSYEIKY
ncbi:MAG: putative ATP-dependent DNA helicase [Ignavibacteriae bacterium]|nr:MAG: putative ATP-dependent DNA helicase [Ignavibacteriota bacterium]